MKIEGMAKVAIDVDPQSIDLTPIELTKDNIDKVIYNLYKRIGLGKYILEPGFTEQLYLDENEEGIYYQRPHEVASYNVVKPKPILVATDEKTIELFKLLKQLESGLKKYMDDSEELVEAYQMKKSMR